MLTLFRNATVSIAFDSLVILIDPMLNSAGEVAAVEDTAPVRRNPLVELPMPAEEIARACDVVAVTHLHNDHFDAAARRLLRRDVPLLCQPSDAERLGADGFTAVMPVADRLELTNQLTVDRVQARHSIGEHETALGPGSGYVFTTPDGLTVYIAGDCVFSDVLCQTLETYRPDVVVANGGAARFLTGEPISMTSEDVIRTARAAPEALVVVVHLEALNHCPMTRKELRRHTIAAGLAPRVAIPADGEQVELTQQPAGSRGPRT
jgi:L-ascorbate metabolism protein UlaG (beta-lactamase superfamily)